MAAELRNSENTRTVLLVITLIGFILRLSALRTAVPDDTGLILLTAISHNSTFSEGWKLLLPFVGGHPPLYYFLAFECGRIFGTLGLFLPSFILGVASIPLLSWMSRPLLGSHISLLAGLLLASSQWHIGMSTQDTPDAALFVTILAAHGALLRYLEAPMPRWTFVTSAAMLFGLYIHEGFLLYVPVALGLLAGRIVVARVSEGVFPPVRSLLLSLCGVFLVVSPHVPTLLKGCFASPPLSWSSFRPLSWGEVLEVCSGGIPEWVVFGFIALGAVALRGVHGASLAAIFLLPFPFFESTEGNFTKITPALVGYYPLLAAGLVGISVILSHWILQKGMFSSEKLGPKERAELWKWPVGVLLVGWLLYQR